MKIVPAVVISPDFVDASRVADGLEAQESATGSKRIATAAYPRFAGSLDAYHSCRYMRLR